MGKSPINETGLDKLIKKCKRNFTAMNNYKNAIMNSQVTFVVVATPSKSDGAYSNKYLKIALKEIGLVLRTKKRYHLIAITSTMMPTSAETVIKPFLEKVSGKICGKDFGLVYNPEFIALGSVIHNFLNPDFLLIGESYKKDGDILKRIYKKTCENNPRFARMGLTNAEIAKIAVNCYVTMKITFANTLAAMCENTKNADAYTITDGIGLDSRIGTKYLKPGLGFGGPCFPRDNIAFSVFGKRVKAKAMLAEVVDKVNNAQASRVVKKALKLAGKIGKKKKDIAVGVLGLTYKPNTNIVERSQSIDIVKELIRLGYRVEVYDPVAMNNAAHILKKKVIYSKSLSVCLKRSDLLIIATAWDEFKRIKIKNIKRGAQIYDCWKVLSEQHNIKHLGRF
ncbi:MAG: UDP-glucose/GDP-mannose dehydrogenase family protein [Candidatus Omnitrophica bacterium]|nr:UDP-glucose/GDP-mannose dehydrogenase family protein [Candidatus Omnitrophota bacterium]